MKTRKRYLNRSLTVYNNGEIISTPVYDSDGSQLAIIHNYHVILNTSEDYIVWQYIGLVPGTEMATRFKKIHIHGRRKHQLAKLDRFKNGRKFKTNAVVTIFPELQNFIKWVIHNDEEVGTRHVSILRKE